MQAEAANQQAARSQIRTGEPSTPAPAREARGAPRSGWGPRGLGSERRRSPGCGPEAAEEQAEPPQPGQRAGAGYRPGELPAALGMASPHREAVRSARWRSHWQDRARWAARVLPSLVRSSCVAVVFVPSGARWPGTPGFEFRGETLVRRLQQALWWHLYRQPCLRKWKRIKDSIWSE